MKTLGHYQGERGERYFAWQNRAGIDQGRIEARKFAAFVAGSNTVVDFGCGSGAMLASLVCARRIGVEVNPSARAEAERHGIEVYGSAIDVPAGVADVVVSNHALEHVPSPLETLEQLRSVLEAGGRLVLCLPIDDWRTQKRPAAGDRNHHLYTWTPQLLANLLSEAGFVVESARVLTHAWPPGWATLDRLLPVALFDAVAQATSVMLRRRQVIAVARRR